MSKERRTVLMHPSGLTFVVFVKVSGRLNCRHSARLARSEPL